MVVNNAYNKLKVGLVLDSEKVPKWTDEAIGYILNNNDIDLYYLGVVKLLNQNKSVFFTVFSFFERIIAKKILSTHSCVDVLYRFIGFPSFNAEVLIDDGIFQFNGELVEGNELDVILYLGVESVRGVSCSDIKSLKNGVMYLSPGDDVTYNNVCPGFWEVYDECPETSIALNVANITTGKIYNVFKANDRTIRASALLNEKNIWFSGVRLIDDFVALIVKGHSSGVNIFSSLDSKVIAEQRYRNIPSVINLVILVIRVVLIKINNYVLNKVKNKPIWTIGILKRTDLNLMAGTLENIKWAKPTCSSFIADPFLYKHDEYFYIFTEIFENKSGKGVIAVSKLLDNLQYTEPKVILKEDWHLSFPFVFDYKNKLYMLPEQGGSGELWIYECIDFPDKWIRKYKIMEDVNCKDAILYYHENRWWCFLSKSYGGVSQNNLYLYYSDDLFGKWVPHLMNPIKNSLKGSRMAGCIIENQSKIYRVAQNSSLRYGGSTIVYQIELLTPSEYKELEVSEFFPDVDFPESNIRLHTLNSCGDFVVIDGTANCN